MYGSQRGILSEKFRQQCGEMEAAQTESSGNTGKLFREIKHCRFCGCDYDAGVIWLWTGDGNAVKIRTKEKIEESKKQENSCCGWVLLLFVTETVTERKLTSQKITVQEVHLQEFPLQPHQQASSWT